ncbi:hypothetical protein GMOD_00002118 [Pyrenophora seminiperda CCB06]|uniref:U6 snRNA phosphodiesterase n=1 Tax=Pyrenophora seminiperda CCB06 TaxID=1302712 RepID=A0A3M7LX05_9PLEO|nr:hypothetical protein GMOD_00002118 [Pyrenophora seminiperda CCB06]
MPLPALKRKHSHSSNAVAALPPLPSAFHDLYASNARISTGDNPSLHGGRKRAVPHIEGNWPSHVYLECKIYSARRTESDALHRLIQLVKDSLELQNSKQLKKLPIPDIVPSLQSELGAPLPLHVSLSRTLQIKTEGRESFLETLKLSLRRSAVCSFNVEFRNLKWVPNFERNRWFLVLSIKRPGQDELNRLLHACNEAAQTSGHPGLYTGAEGDGPMEDTDLNDNLKRRKVDKIDLRHLDLSKYFHVTIAWNLTEPDTAWTTLVQQLDTTAFIQSPEATFDTVKVRIGSAVHNIALSTRRLGLGKGEGLGLR